MVEAGYDYVYKLSITDWYTPPTMTLRASCVTHGHIRRSMTFSVVYKDRHASDHRCFWMRWIEPADCRLMAEMTHAMATLCIGTSVSDAASSSAYAASLPACTASIKKPGHDSVHGDRDCDGLRCDSPDTICLLSCNELWPASMLPRSHHWGSAHYPALSSLPSSLITRPCPAPTLLWCVSVRRQTSPVMLHPASLCPPRRLCVDGFTPACWCFCRARAGPTKTPASSSPRLLIRAGAVGGQGPLREGLDPAGGRDVPRLKGGLKERFGVGFGVCLRQLQDSATSSSSASVPATVSPVAPTPGTRSKAAMPVRSKAPASRSCEPSLMSRVVWGTPPWLLLLELNIHASNATDVRKTCKDVPAVRDADLSFTCCPSYHAVYAYLPSVCAVVISSEAVALHPLRGASGSALCSPRGLQCLPQLWNEPCFPQASKWGTRHRKPRPLPAPRRKLKGWQRRRYWARTSGMWSPAGLALIGIHILVMSGCWLFSCLASCSIPVFDVLRLLMHRVRACSRPAGTGPSLLSCFCDDPVRGPHHSFWSAVWPSSELDHAGPHVVAAPVPSPG